MSTDVNQPSITYADDYLPVEGTINGYAVSGHAVLDANESCSVQLAQQHIQASRADKPTFRRREHHFRIEQNKCSGALSDRFSLLQEFCRANKRKEKK